MEWIPNSAYDAYQIEWRNQGADRWTFLGGGESGLRAIVHNSIGEADIRGFAYHETVPIEVRVIGVATGSNRKSAPTVSMTVHRDYRPLHIIGHQHDHVVSYTDASLGNTTVEQQIKQRLSSAASLWSGIGGVVVCKGCDANEDRETVTWQVSFVTGSTVNSACKTVACVSSGVTTQDTIEHHIGNAVITIESPGHYDEGHNYSAPFRIVEWTTVVGLHGMPKFRNAAPGSIESRIYFEYIGYPIRHEFGHVVGVADVDPELYPNYHGLMRRAFQIQQDDKDVVKDIYKSHTKMRGW